ncbi:MAG: S8/S53 family peptidase [Bdellovibrionales bacterium]|jgi:hypothetical protein|nr:S8/S53 family peptidase [Bdellovibrionales bacterium]
MNVILSKSSDSKILLDLLKQDQNIKLSKITSLKKGNVFFITLTPPLSETDALNLRDKFCHKVKEIYGDKMELCALDHRVSKGNKTDERPCPHLVLLDQPLGDLSQAMTKYITRTTCSFTQEMAFGEIPENIDSRMDGLSPFWAQDRVGEDLALELMAEQDEADALGQTLSPVVLDQSWDDERNGHGPIVRDIIQNGSYEDPAIAEHSISYSSDDFVFQQQVEDGITNLAVGTVINRSLSRSAQSTWSLYHFGQDGYLPVQSAGNNAPYASDSITSSDRSEMFITVGSTSPLGTASNFSSPARPTIYAPSDLNLSVRREGETGFSGTSGSTPLVSSSLVNLQSMLDNKLNVTMAKELLTKSGSPTLQSLFSQNEAGELNHYKLLRIGKRLRERCTSEGGDITQNCLENQMRDEGLYVFEPEINWSEVDNGLPGCDRQGFPPRQEERLIQRSNGDGLCPDQQSLFKTLRKEALLNPTIETYRCLAGVYHSLGNPIDASHYAAIANAMMSPPQILFPPEGFNELSSDRQATAFVNLARLRPEILNNISNYLNEEALSLALNLPPPEGISSLGEEGLNLLRSYIYGTDTFLAEQAVSGIGHMASINLFNGRNESGINSGDNIQDRRILQSSRHAKRLLDTLAENSETRELIAASLNNIPYASAYMKDWLNESGTLSPAILSNMVNAVITETSDWSGEVMRLGMRGQEFYDDRVVRPLIDQLMETDGYYDALSLCLNKNYCRDGPHREAIYRGMATDNTNSVNLIEQLSGFPSGQEYAANAFTIVTNGETSTQEDFFVEMFNQNIENEYGSIDNSEEENSEDDDCRIQVTSFQDISSHSCYQRLKDDTDFDEIMENLSNQNVLNEGVTLP